MNPHPITNRLNEEPLESDAFRPGGGQRCGGSSSDDDGRTGVMIGDVVRQISFGIKSIPTTYRGVCFRSRLEARWAAFFDLAAWKWEYEPFDMDGWAPDFLIRGRTINTLVEVKPAVWNGESLALNLYEKAIRHSVGNSILLLGVGPIMDSANHAMIGMCNEPCDKVQGACGFDRAMVQDADSGAAFGFCSYSMSYADRISDYYDGGAYGSASEAVIEAWKQAGNLVQWRPM